jgi:hypothetical protein
MTANSVLDKEQQEFLRKHFPQHDFDTQLTDDEETEVYDALVDLSVSYLGKNYDATKLSDLCESVMGRLQDNGFG